jgi:hypothetical protein
MVVQTTLVSDLLRDELRMVSCGDTFVDDFLLIRVFKEVCVYELSHFYVISEDVERNVDALGDSNKLVIVYVLLIGLGLSSEEVFVFSESTSLESSDWRQNFAQPLIVSNRFQFEATGLSVEELAHIKGVGIRLVFRKLVKQESVFMFIYKF